MSSDNVAKAYTTNGAPSYADPDPDGIYSGRLSLMSKAVRDLDQPILHEYMARAAIESVTDAIQLAFYIRDPRGGLGERTLGRWALEWLCTTHPSTMTSVVHLMPEYGRWDDLVEIISKHHGACSLIPPEVGKAAMSHLVGTLRSDLSKKKKGQPASLAAKWVPTEGGATDVNNVYKRISAAMKLPRSAMRKQVISPLRKYLDITERKMCGDEWGNIVYSNVPSNAMHCSKAAFKAHDETRFGVWENQLSTGETTVNGIAMCPAKMALAVRRGKTDEVLKAQWDIVEDSIGDDLEGVLFVVDTSASMTVAKLGGGLRPLDVALAIGLLGSNAAKGEWHNKVISFSNFPTMISLPDKSSHSLDERIEAIRGIDWGGSTDMRKTFRLVLDRTIEYGEAPRRVVVVTDMGFDYTGNSTALESIDAMYDATPFDRPELCFWNVASNGVDFPSTTRDDGVVTVGGYSPCLFSVISGSERISAVGTLRRILESPRHELLRNILRKTTVSVGAPSESPYTGHVDVSQTSSSSVPDVALGDDCVLVDVPEDSGGNDCVLM